MGREDESLTFLPAPPPGGGHLFLHKSQYENAELRAIIAKLYPNTKVTLIRPIPCKTSTS